MKKLLLSLALAASTFAGYSQISTNTPTYGFFSTAMDWFANIDTNNPIWLKERAEVFTVVESQPNETEFGLGVKVPVWKCVQVEGLFKNAAIAGTVTAAQGGLGLGIPYGNLKINPYVHAGYSLQFDKLYVAPGIALLKGMTKNTYTGIGLEADVAATNFGKNRQSIIPKLQIYVGVTF
jgi:hypothetical protein